jgi:opine dehydrogenase
VVAEANNLPYNTRPTGPAQVAIYGRNRVNIALLPADRGPDLIDDLRAIHPFEKVYSDVLEAGLSVVNPGVHSGPCLLSVTAIENSPKRPFFLYEHGVTPASCRLNVQVDNERKAIGHRLTPIEDFSGLPEGYTWQELYMSLHGNIALTPDLRPARPQEPLLHRGHAQRPGAVEHDRPGRRVDTPVIDSIINIYDVVHEQDWRAHGRSADDLGLDGMSVDQILAYVRTGTREAAHSSA